MRWVRRQESFLSIRLAASGAWVQPISTASCMASDRKATAKPASRMHRSRRSRSLSLPTMPHSARHYWRHINHEQSRSARNAAFILHPSSFILHPFDVRAPRRGTSSAAGGGLVLRIHDAYAAAGGMAAAVLTSASAYHDLPAL